MPKSVSRAAVRPRVRRSLPLRDVKVGWEIGPGERRSLPLRPRSIPPPCHTFAIRYVDLNVLLQYQSDFVTPMVSVF